jgi:hypothetical protein
MRALHDGLCRSAAQGESPLCGPSNGERRFPVSDITWARGTTSIFLKLAQAGLKRKRVVSLRGYFSPACARNAAATSAG